MKKNLYGVVLGTLSILSTLCGALQYHEGDESDANIDVEKLMVDDEGATTALIDTPMPDKNNEVIIAHSDTPPDLLEPDQDQGIDQITPSLGRTKLCDAMDQEIPEGKSTEDLAPDETGPHIDKGVATQPWWVLKWWRPSEGTEPCLEEMSQLQLSGPNDIALYFGGELKDDLFIYDSVYTLRSDYHDQNNFIRHKLNLDIALTQGTKKYKAPASQACIRLTNYVFWNDEAQYAPFTIEQIGIPPLDSPEFNNMVIARDVKVKPLLPLIFVEQAWFKLNFDVFNKRFQDLPTFLKVGYFPYIVGRGVVLGHHDDLAVEYLGWAGEGGFTRFPFMPPGVLFHISSTKDLSLDLYYNLWKETSSSLADNLKPDRQSRLYGPPERGSGKNRNTWVQKLNFNRHYDDFGNLLLEQYVVYVDAPEQRIEMAADSSSKLFTLGVMADWHHKGWSANLEVAGQTGRQRVHAIDRNIEKFGLDSNGSVQAQFSHVLTKASGGDNVVVHPSTPVRRIANATNPIDVPRNQDLFEPQNQLSYLVQNLNNRELSQQDETILKENGTNATVFTRLYNPFNSNLFGNNRFRNPYKLTYQGFLAMFDLCYEFEDHPFKVAGALGYISGDNYPYNDEVDKYFNGFVPMRSRYRGLGVKNYLIFDRLVIPRPLNIAYQTMYAFNDVKDLSNLQYIGLGLTWYPYKKERETLAFTADLTWLWEAATLRKWDKYGQYPDPTIEQQIARFRNTLPNGIPTKFQGWESTERAHRMIGTELDLRAVYKILNHCDWSTKLVLFFPGRLYKDLDGQPNVLTRRIDERGYLHYDSLGHQVAFAFVTGLDYRF